MNRLDHDEVRLRIEALPEQLYDPGLRRPAHPGVEPEVILVPLARRRGFARARRPVQRPQQAALACPGPTSQSWRPPSGARSSPSPAPNPAAASSAGSTASNQGPAAPPPSLAIRCSGRSPVFPAPSACEHWPGCATCARPYTQNMATSLQNLPGSPNARPSRQPRQRPRQVARSALPRCGRTIRSCPRRVPWRRHARHPRGQRAGE